VVIIASLFEKRAQGLSHNTTAVLDADGTYLGKYRKMHIPDDPAYYEKFYFTPSDLGYKIFKSKFATFCVLICWDQWYPEAARLMALAGADVLIYPTSIGWESMDTEDEKQRQLNAWITVQRGHAVANGIPVIAVNRTGFEADPSKQTKGITFWGNSFACGPQGEILYQAPFDQEIIQIIDIEIRRAENVRRWWPFMRDRRIDAYDEINKRFRD
jgi:N-carbamoylputrescine amidase